MKIKFFPFAISTFSFLTFATMAAAAPPDRIHAHVDSSSTFVLSGNVNPAIASATDLGPVDSSVVLPHIALHFTLTAAQSAQLHQLIADQQNPASPQYHHWLTPEQFQQKFGLSSADISKLTAWLHTAGFQNVKLARGGLSVSMSGTVGQVDAAFQTSIHQYSVNGQTHYANATDPVLPAALQGVVGGIRGLNDFRPHPNVAKFQSVPALTLNNGQHAMSPADFAVIYDLQSLYNSGINGSGVKIAVPAQSDIVMANVTNFRNAAGLAANSPTTMLATGSTDPGVQSSNGNEQEAELDVSWAGAVAPNASIVLVTADNASDALSYIIQNNVAPVVTYSYTTCEATITSQNQSAVDAELSQANTQGMTILTGSGDQGPFACDSPGNTGATTGVATHGVSLAFPASSPSVTAVGGTEFLANSADWSAANGTNGASALLYPGEEGWNDSTSTQLSASGGGVSTLYSRPTWQQTAQNVPSGTMRLVPDVALSASTKEGGYVVCSTGGCTKGFADANGNVALAGGTSASTPAFAGMVALIDQLTAGNQGNINARLYQLASAAGDVFHDITAGNNVVSCQVGSSGCPASGTFGYSAGPGYDLVTGLGSVDGANLVNSYAPDFKVTINPSSMTLNGSSSTANVQITPVGRFRGAVTFTCSVPSSLTGTSCSVAGTVSGGSGSATLTVTHSTASSGLLLPLWRSPRTGPLFLAFGFFVATAMVKQKRRRLTWALAGSALVLTACGGASTSQTITPAQTTGTVTVTANAASTSLTAALSHTATVSVTVP